MNQDVLHCDRTLCANAAQCQQCINELVKLIAGWICSKVSTFATVAKLAQAGEWLTRNAVWSQSAAATVKIRTHRSSEDQGALHLLQQVVLSACCNRKNKVPGCIGTTVTRKKTKKNKKGSGNLPQGQ